MRTNITIKYESIIFIAYCHVKNGEVLAIQNYLRVADVNLTSKMEHKYSIQNFRKTAISFMVNFK